MANVKATDLIDFTRASKGHALAKISYGDNELPSTSFEVIGTGTWDNIEFIDTVGSQVRPGVTSQTSLTDGTTYALFINITEITGATQVRVDGLDGTDRLLGEGDHRISFISNGGTPRVRLEDTSTSVNDGFTLQSALTAKEVLFNQPDGTIQLFEHPNNIPRIEYDADGNLLGLLIEEARTNLQTYSSDFSSGWNKLTSFATANALEAPDGTTTAVKFGGTVGSTNMRLTQAVSLTSGTTYTYSIFAKAGEFTTLRTQRYDTNLDSWATEFDLSSGTITSGIGEIQDVGDGWYRCSGTIVCNTTATTGVLYVCEPNGTGDGTSGIYVWGAQLEAGSFPTSYIKTTGSTATRSADVASIDVDQFGYNQSEGTLFAEAQMLIKDVSYKAIANLNTNGSNRIRMISSSSVNVIQAEITNGGTTQMSISEAIPEGSLFSGAIAYKQNDSCASVNGSVETTDTSCTIPAVTKLDIMTSNSGHIKSITYTPKRLSNAKLQELTS